MVWCFGTMWSTALGLTSISLDENCAGGDDEGEWGEKCCTQWDEWNVECRIRLLVCDVLVWGSTRRWVCHPKMSHSFSVFGLGSWEESTLSLLLRFFLLLPGRVLKWRTVVTKWLQMSSVSPIFLSVWAFDYIRASLFQNFFHCPCQPFQLCALYCFCGKNLTCSLHF